MAFTAESRAAGQATAAENRQRKAAGLPPLATPKKRTAGKRRVAAASRKSGPTITLTPPDVTASTPPQSDPGAPQALGDPGNPPDASLHRSLMVVFGPINYLLHKLGGFDLMEDEANMILIPAERILVRRGLAAHGQLPPDLFDGIQIAVGVMTYGIRLAPAIAAKRTVGGRGGSGGGAAAHPGQSPRGGNQAPGVPTGPDLGPGFGPALTAADVFAQFGNVAEVHPGNGFMPHPGNGAGNVGSPGASGG